jgi:predicted ATPase/class 3 adenylate cyclase
MTFDEVLEQVRELLQRKGRVAYRALKRRFELDDEYLEDLKAELIDAEHVAHDEDGKVLVWTGSTIVVSSQLSIPGSSPPDLDVKREAERRQLTVLFCDLVDSTALSALLDPEELREVVRAYHETCAGVIRRYGGHTAQHLGDGLLVYFGYPAAHEDDAQRAVRTGLEILAGLQTLNARLPLRTRARFPHPLQVRIGIHTGLVVIGEIGGADKYEILALGETPNVAARLQGLAAPDTVVISAVTARLVQNAFALEELGTPSLKGVTEPLAVARVRGLLDTQNAVEDTPLAGVPFLVGREEEVGLLRRRWEQSKEGLGQVVLITGEAGIGKTTLEETLRREVHREGATRITFRCSPYHQNSALYPVIAHLQRWLQFERDEPPATRLEKLERVLATYRFPLAETVPLFAALLSVAVPEGRYPSLDLTPQQQKQQTHDALAAWLMEETERQAVLAVWEDLQWADPSTLEVLGLAIDQMPTVRMLTVLTFRPDFLPPWPARSHMTQLTLNRLERPQVEALVRHLAGGKALPAEVLQQIVSKTDGVPLFVEELTKMVLESPLLRLAEGHYELSGPLPPFAIPATLQDSLMARLDRLSEVREVVQLGAVLGREFAYEVLRLLTTSDETTLQARLARLVAAELLYQRGRPPRARYVFKHALIQDAAYASMLKSMRQRAHQQIGQLFTQRFPELVETQPEVVAHHYTEAGLTEQAVVYWQQAGQRARQRSAHAEAINHLTRGLEVLTTLPDTPERTQQELVLQITLGASLMTIKGPTAPDVERTYARARALCQEVGDFSQLSRVLFGLWGMYQTRAEHKTAQVLGEQLLELAQQTGNPISLLVAHHALGAVLWWQGELTLAREHLDQALAIDASQPHPQGSTATAITARVATYNYAAFALWSLGYPDQALQRKHEALILAHELLHPYSMGFAMHYTAQLHIFRREAQAALEQSEAELALAAKHGFALWIAGGAVYRGWALAEQGQVEEGIAQIRQGLAAWRAMGSVTALPLYIPLLAEAYGKAGQAAEGLSVLAEALTLVDKTGERVYEAELYRLKGTLTLQSQASPGQVSGKSQASQDKSKNTNPQPLTPDPQAEAEACFQKAIEIARHQQAKLLELRAVMSLSRLWQTQGKKDEARRMLAEIYGWFTEGFDTADLKDAKALLDELS